MPNSWTFDQPNTLVFENPSAGQILTITNTGSGEWQAALTKSGTDKGTIKLDNLQAFKDMFSQIAPLLPGT